MSLTWIDIARYKSLIEQNLTLSKFGERIESDNSNLWITHRKLKPLILMIWTFFHRIIFLKNRLGFFFIK
jgi:hypothetical protein